MSCSDAKGVEDVMVVLKTSAVEMYEKLREHLLTLFRCTPHYAIFSDLQGVFAGQNIYDALENVTAETREKQKEFEHYKKGIVISGFGHYLILGEVVPVFTVRRESWSDKFLESVLNQIRGVPTLM